MSFQKMSKDLLLFAHNPAAMQSISLNRLADGDLILRDPTDPVAFLAEMAVMIGHTTIEGVREQLPKCFPSMAQTPEDLYRHISDKDLIDVFALPSAAEMLFYIDVDSLMQKAMPLVTQGIRRIIFPRDTVFKVAGYDFAIQYPIEIRILPYATMTNHAFQVLWLTEIQSPISPVTTNALEWSITNAPGHSGDVLLFKVPVKQYSVSTRSDTVTPASEMVMYHSFNDDYFMARVWMRKEDSKTWVELATTLSQRTYDVNNPTAVLQVLNGRVRMTIPAIYINKGLVSGEIRLDVYSTIGKLELDLGSFTTQDYSFGLRDLNKEIDEAYVNPIKSLAVKELIGVGKTSGGRAALPFEKLRENVIANAVGTRRRPITPSQLSAATDAYGLEMSRPIDYVTDRLLHLSRTMPDSTLKSVNSPLGTVSAPMFFTWDQLAALPTARVNGNRITVLPETIYSFDGVNVVFDPQITETLKLMQPVDVVKLGNAKQFLFTPFYYVMDINNASIDVRVYHLDQPAIDSKRFITTNVTSGLSVVTADYQFHKSGENYVLRVLTKSDKTYQSLLDEQVFAQIQFTPRTAGGNAVTIFGELKGKKDGERVFEFLFESNLDIDRNDELVLTNTYNRGGTQVDTPTSLLNDFNIIYGCQQYYPGSFEPGELDKMIMGVGRDAIGVTHEVFGLRFGWALEWYWRSSRPMTDSINYKYYQEDVLEVYTVDKIKYEDGIPVYTVDPNADPMVQFVYEHRKGDPVIDPETGKQRILHEKGSQVYEDNKPVIDKPRSIKFMLEMIGYDARYRMANGAGVQEYLADVFSEVVKTVTVELPLLGKDYLERTKGFFRPTNTMGNITVRREDGTAAPVPAEQRFTVFYYMSAANRENSELLKSIRTTTSQIISRWLTANRTISTTDICRELKSALAGTVLGVEMELMGPERDMRIYTVLDEAAHAMLGKKLDIDPDGSVVIKDDITLSFNRHDVDM